MRVSVAAGRGRAIRFGATLAFTAAPVDGLFEAISATKEQRRLFQSLATIVTNAGFETPAFVVVSPDAGAAFVFGDVELRIPSEDVCYSGVEASTWLEVSLTPDAMRVGTIGEAPIDADDTNLVDGCVPASGLLWARTDFGPLAPTTSRRSNRLAVPDTAISDSDAAAVDDGGDLIAEPRVDGWAEQTEETVVGRREPAAHGSGNVSPAGSTNRVDEFEQSVDSLEFDADEDTLIPSSAVLQDIQRQTNQGQERPSWVLKFDDGSLLAVDRDLIVGRNPYKEKLPDGYVAFVVNSDHVSRRHWELTVDGPKAWIRDLGSVDGTRVSTSSSGFSRSIPAEAKTPIESDSTISFGDRHARIVWH